MTSNQTELWQTNQIVDHNEMWRNVSHDLYNNYGDVLYGNWFSKINFIEFSVDIAVLAAPTNFIRDWVKAKYSLTILQFLRQYNPIIKSVEIITKELSCNVNNFIAHDTKIIDNFSSDIEEHSSVFDIDYTLDSRSTFDNFVVGAPNELAYAAARSIAESSSAVAESNPLFLYGGVGLGKTHLMHSIAWYIKENNPARKVIYMSAEKFMYRFIKSIRNKDVMSFKEEFRSVDLLMIDDIQFICGKDSTQEEFFHTFNALIDNNRQIIISSDRSPSDLRNMEDRIKSRLGWGLVADVHSTTYELRLGILESKLEQMNIKIPRNVVEFLANKIASNVRELEGALNKVIAHSTLVGKELSVENTRHILSDLIRAHDKTINIDDIQKIVAEQYNIRLVEMFSATRCISIARPRQIAMYLSKMLTSKSLVDISRKFGKKDHTTVMHAIKKIEELSDLDHTLKEEIKNMTQILQN